MVTFTLLVFSLVTFLWKVKATSNLFSILCCDVSMQGADKDQEDQAVVF